MGTPYNWILGVFQKNQKSWTQHGYKDARKHTNHLQDLEDKAERTADVSDTSMKKYVTMKKSDSRGTILSNT